MKLAIIGAYGQVGQEFQKHFPSENLILLGHEDVEVLNSQSVRAALREADFDVVINLAAFHNTNGCEAEPAKALYVNALGARHVAAVARELGRKVVYVSSDYVFGGNADRRRPYTEADHVYPVNLYGASKAAGEMQVRTTTDEHLIIRTSSLFGTTTSGKGWTFPEMVCRRALAGESLRFVDDQIMAPTYTFELVRAILELLAAGAAGTFHVAGGGECSWYEFAEAALDEAGIEHPIRAVASKEFPTPAKRPAYSTLASRRMKKTGVLPLSHWRDGLRAYFEEKGVSIYEHTGCGAEESAGARGRSRLFI